MLHIWLVGRECCGLSSLVRRLAVGRGHGVVSTGTEEDGLVVWKLAYQSGVSCGRNAVHGHSFTDK